MRASALKFLRAGLTAASLAACTAAVLGTTAFLAPQARADEPARGGTLTMVISPAPQILTSAFTTAGAEQVVSSKISDSLFTYDFDMNVTPQLAESYEVSPDGLRVTFHLRKGVKWHDGAPFTSEDVAYTTMNAWKVLHGRGRTIFGNVTAVETPDENTAVFVLSKPSPGMLKSLAAQQTQILPAHLYKGTDIATNPANLKPVGTGPFRFVSFQPGDNLVLERNPDYWDTSKPYLDKLIFRFVPDAATRAAMLESGEADIVNQSLIPPADIERLKEEGDFITTTKGYEFQNEVSMMEFNLDDPVMKDIRVRKAIAHAIDKKWIVENILFGYGLVAETPLHPHLTQLYDTNGVPKYDFDPAKAKALLDEAGYKPDANGVRLKITVDPLPYGDLQNQIAAYMREALRGVGIELNVRTEDFAGFVKRVYTDRDFQMTINLLTGGSDPTIGTQRTFWSKSFKLGVGFSNGSHYVNPKMDEILETAASEMDPAKRKAEYLEFQKLAMEDLPALPLVAVESVTVANKRVHNYTIDAHGTYGNFATVWVDPKK
ncbi:ABC transporter substrate-binding protein [Ancylobacter pratisalsi]|uniref:ABC transporter substrate-binding protein n=1 Tax=Ancylobacter pratisalsi TaxID=1745854 RepID=A0A6P1YPE5_9HYPH|nr:ABC transporter substrate-binding protein [Ancylobacter pratisalsi]QIB34601.1 ABC transporter substrate-binding protein [Ancylobacter pratisalsi]